MLQLKVQGASSKYQIASMVTEVAHNYNFITEEPQARETVQVTEKGNTLNP